MGVRLGVSCGLALLTLACGGGNGGGGGEAPNELVRSYIEALAPAANLGHRGTGLTRRGHRFPENSIPSFLEALTEGADGIELDVEITEDGRIVVMHDDDVDRTTDCTGCVSALTFDEVRACHLLDGAGNPTEEHPPTLAEVYAAVQSPALVNVELKVYGDDCATATTGAASLVDATLAEIAALGVQGRTLFSSFDLEAATRVKVEQPDYYSALLYSASADAEQKLDDAIAAGLDAVHPFFLVVPEAVTEALDAGLQVNVWTVDTADQMEANIHKGATAIITNSPATLAAVIAD